MEIGRQSASPGPSRNSTGPITNGLALVTIYNARIHVCVCVCVSGLCQRAYATTVKRSVVRRGERSRRSIVEITNLYI